MTWVSGAALIYTQIAFMQKLSDIENGEVPSLAFLSFDGPLDGQSREQAIGTLARLDLINLHLVIGGSNLRKATEDLGLGFSHFQRNETSVISQRARHVYGSCAKLPKV